MIESLPSAAFEAYAEGYGTGLTGTIGVSIEDGDGVTVLARQTTGIVESPSGSGIYAASLTAPAVGGTYAVVWDDGSIFRMEELTVAVVFGDALCTLAQVREFLEFPDADTARDELIISLIPRVTAAIQSETQREFIPVASATRVFEYRRRDHIIDLIPHDIRSVVSVTFTDGGTIAASDVDYYLAPIHSKDGTYRFLKFAPDFSPDASDFESSFGVARVSVSGAWGFASVPSDVIQAAAITVGAWMARDVASFGLEGLEEPRGMMGPLPVQYAIPTPAWRLLSAYARRTVV